MDKRISDPRGAEKVAVALGLGLLAAGCSSGGGDDAASAGIDRGGIEGPTISVGQITGFGSVIVKGVRWNTDSAEVFVDDVAAFESALAIGQVVRIEGTRTGTDTGNATRIESDDLLEGFIESIDTAARELVVVGQTVTVTDRTIFDDDIVLRSLDGLSVGQRVEIDGFISSGGSIRATYIELDDDDEDESEITGFVANLNLGAFTFEINGITVDYSAATSIDLPGGEPADGMLIEVEGTYDAATGVLTARELDDEDFFGDRDESYEIEIEGYVTRFASATDFDVSGIPVTTTSATEFDDGSPSDLVEGIRVEVEGRFDGNGVLVAEEIEFEDDDGIEGYVTRFVSATDFDVSGIPVTTTAATEFDGGSASDLAEGIRVEVEGRFDGNGVLVAKEIEFEDDGDDFQCPQDNPAAGQTIESDVNVNGVCTLTDVAIAGRIMVQPGSELTLSGSTVGKGLQALEAVSIDITDTSFIENIQITDTSQRVELVNVSTNDNIQLEKNQGQIQVESFVAGQDFQLKESVADIFVSGTAGRNAQIEKTVGGTLTVEVTVGEDAQLKENVASNSTDVQLFGGDQAQCLDNNFDSYASGFTDVDGCIPL